MPSRPGFALGHQAIRLNYTCRMSESLSSDDKAKLAAALARHRASLHPKVQRLLAEDDLREALAEQTGTPKAAIEAMSLVREHGHRRANSIAYHVLQAELGYRVAVFEAVDGRPIEAGENEPVTRGDYQREVLRWIDEYRSMLPRTRV